MREDYYSILKVDRSAPQEVVHAAYRTLMGKMKKHPDLGGDEEEAKEIIKAYQVLRDPRSRAEYDKSINNKSISNAVEPGAERRRAERRPSSASISFCLKHDYTWHQAVLGDISELGLKFKSRHPLVKGQEITVSWPNHTCQAVRGVVRWARMYHPNLFERVYEAGVEFEGPVADVDSRIII